jgi:VWFA-related protein
VLCVALAAGLLGHAADEQAEPGADPPREIGLTEKATGQLAQLDVTVRGPREVIGSLSADDFELVVAGRFIEGFLVDRVCAMPDAQSPPAETDPAQPAPATPPATPAPPRARASYLFYFDHHHLTQVGRQNALDIARSLIPRLITGDNRATIVSAGEDLVTFAALTDDQAELLDALDRIEHDNRQWDLFAFEEDLRIQQVAEEFYEDSDRAVGMARRFQREERYHTDRALRLFSLVLGRMADLDPPKAAIYFADTMRTNAGAHYLSFFGASERDLNATVASVAGSMEMDAMAAGAAFDRVVEEAAAHGVRLYTVQAEGLVTASSLRPIRSRGPEINTRHIVDAQNSLVSMAMETGGQAFINGVPAAKIAKKITADMDCLYLLSFDPAGLPIDELLPVLVRVKRSKVDAHARGTLLLQSEESRVTSRLMAAFTAPGAANAEWPLRGVIIPTGYEDGRYHSLVQVAVPGSPLAQTEWDVGFSMVSRGKVREDDSARVTLNDPGVPVVFEKEISFKPGPYEIIMVARETNSDQLATSQIDGDWPDPDAAPCTVGPIAVLQPSSGAFLREGKLSTRGALGKDDVQPAHTDLPTVLVGLVCRNRFAKERLRVERRLVGDEPADFPPIELDLRKERCAQIRDSIPAGMMTAGGFVYEIRVLQDGEELAAGSREFGALGTETASGAATTSGG